jgi:hypothetical protein
MWLRDSCRVRHGTGREQSESIYTILVRDKSTGVFSELFFRVSSTLLYVLVVFPATIVKNFLSNFLHVRPPALRHEQGTY